MWGCWSGRYLSVDVLGAQIMFETRQNICVHYKTTYIYIYMWICNMYILIKSITENMFRWIQTSASSSCYYQFPLCIFLSKKSTEWSVGNFHTSEFRKFSGFRRDSGSHFSATLFFNFAFRKLKRYNGIPSKLLTYSTLPPPFTKKSNNSQAPPKIGEKDHESSAFCFQRFATHFSHPLFFNLPVTSLEVANLQNPNR